MPSTPPPLLYLNGSDLHVCRAVGTMMTVWHKSKAKINRLLGNPDLEIPSPPNISPETWTTHEPIPPTRPFPLPYDIVEMVIAHLTHDLGALKTCSLACRSWYTTAAPHLHHTLTLKRDRFNANRNLLKPLSKLHELGLLHLVKTLQVKQALRAGRWFVPYAFSDLDLHHFAALANVHTLKLQNVEICRFIPEAADEHHFGHFSQILRSVSLRNPSCTPRQLSHFLSLFPNLDDIGIKNIHRHASNTTTPDTELVPFSAPRLRGRLALDNISWVEVWTHLMASSSGLQFRHMDLRASASCAPVLFEACAETLESLRFGTRGGSASKQLCLGLSADLS